MGDLSDLLPQQTETVRLIYEAAKRKGDAEPARGYLGASIVGHECDAYLWFVFRGAAREDVEGRIYRLWDTGHREEERLAGDLREIGVEVKLLDEKGEQFAIPEALGGHFSAHTDGFGLNVPEAPKKWHVLELKTSNAKNFARLQKEGVRSAKPAHFAQMQVYMGGFGLDRALYLVRNKDTDELYSERIKFDRKVYDALLERAKRVIEATSRPQRCASRPDDWRCKFCPAAKLCWGGADVAVPLPAQTCKTCCHATPLTVNSEGARWRCDKYGQEVDPSVGAKCPTHLLLPGMIAWAQPADAGEDAIQFQNDADKALWWHGNAAGQWSTRDLMATKGPLEPHQPRPSSGSAATAAEPPVPTSTPAGAEPTPASPSEALLALDLEDLPLLARYPWTESEKVWSGPAGDLEPALKRYALPVDRLGEPRAAHDDERVNAAEFATDHGDFLIVNYKADGIAAIWRGKS